MENIFNRIEAHEEQTRRLNEELLAERDTTQAKIDQLTTYRYELDALIQRRGIRPNMTDEFVRSETRDSRIVKRTPREKAAYVASVPVEHASSDSSIRQLIRTVSSDGQKRTKNEIFDLVRERRPDAKRLSFETMFSKIGMHSCENDRPGARRGTRLYWYVSTNIA